MQNVLVVNRKRLVQGCKNAVEHSRRMTKNVEYANIFLPVIFHAYGCCMAKLNMCVLLKIAARY